MYVKEIGSEFAAEKPEEIYTDLSWLPTGRDTAMCFSGRTAIETALRNIPCKRKALLPAWCCQSMVQPFLDQGVAVSFYCVEAAADGVQLGLQIPEDCDVLLLCSYFGFSTEYPQEQLAAFQDRGGIVIEDITHSLLSQQNDWEQRDYLVASLRKWGALSNGGFCASAKGLAVKPSKQPLQLFLTEKQEAMTRKAAYLQGVDPDKAAYLALYAQSNALLAEQYTDTRMSEPAVEMLKTWDISQMRNTRRKNAQVLYAGLKNISGLKPLFPEEKMDCPLFVPILVDGCRDALRQHLIDRQIYCPVHWPAPQGAKSGIYERELSLVCDQRYSTGDMERMIAAIGDFMKRS